MKDVISPWFGKQKLKHANFKLTHESNQKTVRWDVGFGKN